MADTLTVSQEHINKAVVVLVGKNNPAEIEGVITGTDGSNYFWVMTADTPDNHPLKSRTIRVAPHKLKLLESES